MKTSTQGLLFGLMAYTLWGFFPLFFHLLRSVEAIEVLMHRVIWSFVFVGLIMLLLRRKAQLIKAFHNRSILLGLCLSSLLVSFNWLVFIWAVAQGQVVETSLGYFITPLVSVFLARVILKEKMNKWRQWAILLAGLGILWLILRIGYLPWVSFSLAISFGLYGLVRKQLDVDTLTGLTLETLLLLPLALAYWWYLDAHAESLYAWPPDRLSLLLMASGILTATPLLLFASATKKLSLSVIGFLMYINPSLQFMVAVFILNEPFNQDQLIGFCFIWCALIIFTAGSFRPEKAVA